MSDFYSDEQKALIDRATRLMAVGGLPLSAELENIRELIDSGDIGISADAKDVDSIALGGGMFTRDRSTYDGSTLDFGWKASRIYTGLALVTVSAGHVTLTGSVDNYIECDRNGVVSSNTSAFTSGRLPLWIVTADVSGYTDNNVTSVKPFLQLISLVNGAMLSTPAKTKEIIIPLGASISATTTLLVPSPNVAAVLVGARFITAQAFTGDDANYWTFALTNIATGAGTNPMLVVGPSTTTKLTGGTPIAANTPVNLPLNGTGSNLITAAGNGLQLTLTKTGTPAAITSGSLALDFTFVV